MKGENLLVHSPDSQVARLQPLRVAKALNTASQVTPAESCSQDGQCEHEVGVHCTGAHAICKRQEGQRLALTVRQV